MRRRGAERKTRAEFPRGCLIEVFSPGNLGLARSRWAGWGVGWEKWGKAGRFVTA